MFSSSTKTIVGKRSASCTLKDRLWVDEKHIYGVHVGGYEGRGDEIKIICTQHLIN